MVTIYPHNHDWDNIAEITGDPALQNLNPSELTDFILSNLALMAPIVPGLVLHDRLEQPMAFVRVLRLFASVRRLIGMY